jgi:hypothetical protein
MRRASQIWQVFFPSQTLHVFFFLSQNLQIFGLALRKKGQYVVVKSKPRVIINKNKDPKQQRAPLQDLEVNQKKKLGQTKTDKVQTKA